VSAARSMITIAEKQAPASLFRDVVRRFVRHRLALIGLVILLFFVLISAFAPVIAPHDPDQVFRNEQGRYSVWQSPSAEHLLGTDRFGRDSLTRLLYGGRVSLLVGLSSIMISTVVGTILGGVAGYYGGWIDNVIMRFTDAVIAFPALFLIITFAVVAGPSLGNIILVISLVYWTQVCRVVRAEFLKLKEMDFIIAVKSLGAGDIRVMVVHMLPNAFPFIVVNVTLDIARAILLEASLSFLGVGVQQPTATWGNMLNEAMSLSVMRNMPWLWAPAGICILLTVLSLNFLGDGLRDALDPRLKR